MLTDVVIANKSYTKLNIPNGDMMDSIALKIMRQDCPDFLLPVKTVEIDGDMEIRYELLDGVRLSYMPRQMSKKDFTELLVNMLLPFKICSDWFLDYHYFLLNETYILVGKNSHAIRYIYVPAEKYVNSDESIKDFFTNLILKTDIKDDVGCMVNLLRILKNQDANLLTLLDYLQQESVPSGVRESFPQSGSNRMQPENGSPFSAVDMGQHASVGGGQPPSMQMGQPAVPHGGSDAGTGGFQAEAGTAHDENLKKEKRNFFFFGERKSQHSDSEKSQKPMGSGNGQEGSGSSGAGYGSEIFGKNDEEGRLIGNLFGESEEPEKGKNKKGKEKSKDKNREKKKEKDQEREKENSQKNAASKGGIFHLLKGKGKAEGKVEGKVEEDDELPLTLKFLSDSGGSAGGMSRQNMMPQGTPMHGVPGRDMPSPGMPIHGASSQNMPSQGMPGYGGASSQERPSHGTFPQGNPYLSGGFQNRGWDSADVEGDTFISDDREIKDNRVLRLRLENCIGCTCPEFIDLDLQNGFAVVGRINKNGEPQADFNFDASVSFVSRRHFRIDRDGMDWQIVDLGSSNGTYVNGMALLPNMPHSLTYNDVIMISANKRCLTYRVY